LVVPRRQRIGAEHDAPLRLVAETGVTRAGDELVVVVCRNAQPVTHTVVAREVGRRLRWSDQVVASEAVFDGAREFALRDVCAQAYAEIDRAADGRGDSWLDA